jgi:hypothetical protein
MDKPKHSFTLAIQANQQVTAHLFSAVVVIAAGPEYTVPVEGVGVAAATLFTDLKKFDFLFEADIAEDDDN